MIYGEITREFFWAPQSVSQKLPWWGGGGGEGWSILHDGIVMALEQSSHKH